MIQAHSFVLYWWYSTSTSVRPGQRPNFAPQHYYSEYHHQYINQSKHLQDDLSIMCQVKVNRGDGGGGQIQTRSLHARNVYSGTFSTWRNSTVWGWVQRKSLKGLFPDFTWWPTEPAPAQEYLRTWYYKIGHSGCRDRKKSTKINPFGHGRFLDPNFKVLISKCSERG